MKNIKEFFTLLKELWANKRWRSWILLGCYIVFFIFLSILFRTSSTSSEIEETNEHNINVVFTNLETISKEDYQYQLIINYQNVLNGKVINGTNSFVYQGIEYLIIYDKIYSNQDYQLMLTENLFDTLIPIEKINLTNIVSCLKEGTLVYDNVITNGFESMYYIDSNRFVETDQTNKISVTLTGKEEQVEKIEINYLTDNCQLIIKE